MEAVRPRLHAALAPVRSGLATTQTVTLERARRDGGVGGGGGGGGGSSGEGNNNDANGAATNSGIAYNVTFAFDAGAAGGEDAAAAAYSRSDSAFAALVLAPLATLADAFAGALASGNRGNLVLFCAATVAILAEQALGISGGGEVAAAATKSKRGAKRQRRGPRFTAAGALRFERDMRALQSFFLSRVRPERFASLRQKFRRLLTAAAVLTVDRITDVFASGGGVGGGGAAGRGGGSGGGGGGRLRVDPAFSPFGVADVRALLLLREDLDAERVRRLL